MAQQAFIACGISGQRWWGNMVLPPYHMLFCACRASSRALLNALHCTKLCDLTSFCGGWWWGGLLGEKACCNQSLDPGCGRVWPWASWWLRGGMEVLENNLCEFRTEPFLFIACIFWSKWNISDIFKRWMGLVMAPSPKGQCHLLSTSSLLHLWKNECFPFTTVLYQKGGYLNQTNCFRLPTIHVQEMPSIINNTSKIKFALSLWEEEE